MNSEYDYTGKSVIVDASWAQDDIERGSLVRMHWSVLNRTENVIIIDGYRVHFYTPDELPEIRESSTLFNEEKETSQRYKSDSHIATILWPEESRTYYWAFVPTEYYGITRRGEWGYRVFIRYRIGDSTRLAYSASKIATIFVRTGHNQIKPEGFLKEFHSQLRELPHLSGEFETKTDYRVAHIGIIDVLIVGLDFVMIINLEPNSIEEIVLNQMRRLLEWASFAYKKKHVLGMILAADSVSAYQSKQYNVMMPSNTSLYIGWIDGRRLSFVFSP